MATDRIGVGLTSPSVSFWLAADIQITDTVNRRWMIRFYLRSAKSVGSFFNGYGEQVGFLNNMEFGRHWANPFLPSPATGWNDGPFDIWVNANAQGYWDGTSTTLPLQMRLTYGNINETYFGSIELPRIGTPPPAPVPVATTPDQITATTLRYQFRSAGNGGSPILRYEYQYSTSSTFASGNSAVIRTQSGTNIVSNLTPNTTYYLRSRTVTAYGNSPWSKIKSGKTGLAQTPGLVITQSPNGKSVTVTLSPPPGMKNVTRYQVQFAGVGNPTAQTRETTTRSLVIPDLTPGFQYQFRARAISGSTVGPWTSPWTVVTMALQNVLPGTYFDGASASRGDANFAWDGTAGSSTSYANGVYVTGWGAFDTGNSVSGGTGTTYRAFGGRSQTYCFGVVFSTDATAAGFHAGIDYAEPSTFAAIQDVVYPAMIHVQLPRRSQRLAAMIVWLDSSSAEIARSIGPDVLVSPSGTEWTPLRVVATPPVGGVRGVLRVIDVQGEGWSTWKGSDVMLLDDAIVGFADYYFDGSTTDTLQWNYAWDGAANSTISRRLDVPDYEIPSPLVDPDCPPVPAPPRPPVIPDSCVETNTLWRRVWQEIPAIYVQTYVDTVPIVRIETNTPVRLLRVRFYQNPFDRDFSELEMNDYCGEQIVSYIPGDTVFTLDGTLQRAYAEVEGSGTALAADSLLRSDDTKWPSLGCGIGYYIAVDVPTDTPESAIEVSYSLVPRYS